MSKPAKNPDKNNMYVLNLQVIILNLNTLAIQVKGHTTAESPQSINKVWGHLMVKIMYTDRTTLTKQREENFALAWKDIDYDLTGEEIKRFEKKWKN